MKLFWQACTLAPFLFATTTALADWVWSNADTTGSGGWAFQTDPSTLNLSDSGTGVFGETGSASASVSLAEGYLKGSVTSDSVFVPQGGGGFTQFGGAHLRIGLGATIDLSGPQDVAGVVAVTMTFDGTYDAPENSSLLYVSSGPGADSVIGFTTSDPSLRGDFGFTDNAVHGQTLQFCYNCTYSIGDDFLITVTAYLPFDAGDTSVFYAADVTMGIQGGSIDGFDTAVFSIVVPEGFTYSSDLMFTDLDPHSVPEPGILALLVAALAAMGVIGRRKAHWTKPVAR